MDGEVEVLKRVPGQGDATLRRLGPGDCFGEIALLGDHIRTATTRSLTAVNVLAVDREAFQALFSTLPPLRMFFERLIEERMAPMASTKPGQDHPCDTAEAPSGSSSARRSSARGEPEPAVIASE
jgi:CRP-like cAMP-binding protein